MILEEHYYFTSEDYDKNGSYLPQTNEETMSTFIERCLRKFYAKHDKHFHPTSITTSALTMKKLERAHEMEEEYYFGTVTLEGKVCEEYNQAIARFEDRGNIVAISSNIKEHEDEPVDLYIDEALDNSTVVVKYAPDDDDNDDDKNYIPDPVDGLDYWSYEFDYEQYKKVIAEKVNNKLKQG